MYLYNTSNVLSTNTTLPRVPLRYYNCPEYQYNTPSCTFTLLQCLQYQYNTTLCTITPLQLSSVPLHYYTCLQYQYNTTTPVFSTNTILHLSSVPLQLTSVPLHYYTCLQYQYNTTTAATIVQSLMRIIINTVDTQLHRCKPLEEALGPPTPVLPRHRGL